jgi:D-sedoheptulose 7-phosphate isomerase
VNMSYTDTFLEYYRTVVTQLNRSHIDLAVELLAKVRRDNGRVFVLGLGGSAANASHMVNDLRKIDHIEAYAPTDNVAEFSARANDDGWSEIFMGWLSASKFNEKDALLVLSVGGGNQTTSFPLVRAMSWAHSIKARIIAIVGRDGGAAAKLADVCILVPGTPIDFITPMVESAQVLVCHILATHPTLTEPLKLSALEYKRATQGPWNVVGDKVTVDFSGGAFEARLSSFRFTPDPSPFRQSIPKAVFLDRDGTLVKLVRLQDSNPAVLQHFPDGSNRGPRRLAELEIMPGAKEACKALKAAGYRLVMVTNQPDIARHLTTKSQQKHINAVVRDMLGLDAVEMCPHDDRANCDCRKPKPGLLQRAAARMGTASGTLKQAGRLAVTWFGWKAGSRWMR